MLKVLDFLAELFPDKGSIPNNFTRGMGEVIQKARVEARFSISDLAKSINTIKKTVEAFEKGEKEVSSSELTYSASVLDKPITYFFPEQLIQYLSPS
jgi:transcriptional regulator with XRE-family HTH domain